MNTLTGPETAKAAATVPFNTTGHSQQRPDCFHCGLPSIVGLEFDEHSFCCPGCRGVYQFLRDARLDGYYQYRDKPSGKPIDSPSGTRIIWQMRPTQPNIDSSISRKSPRICCTMAVII